MSGRSIEINKDNIEQVLSTILTASEYYKEIVVICVGTDKSIQDSVACIVGTLLENKLKNVKVYGTLEYPIHALNLEHKLEDIKIKHKDAFFIGIDACLGSAKDFCKICYRETPVKPGAGVGKTLPTVGDISIICIIGNTKDKIDYFGLQARLWDSYRSAEKICNIIMELDKEITNIKETT